MKWGDVSGGWEGGRERSGEMKAGEGREVGREAGGELLEM